MRIDRDSIGALALVYAIGAIVVFVALYWIRTPWLAWPLTALAAWSCFWQTAFFRVPERKRGGTSRSITSVADGKVVIVERVREPEFLDAECIQNLRKRNRATALHHVFTFAVVKLHGIVLRGLRLLRCEKTYGDE